MRILLLNTDLEPGGTPTVLRELATRLKRAGADVEVACLGRWGSVADQLRDAGVEVTALDARGVRDLRTLPRLIRLIRDRNFCTVFSFLMHANAMAAAASLVVPDVRWIQSIQTTQPMPRWHWCVQRVAQHAAEKIVVPSPSVADVALRWAGVPSEKIVVIPNAVYLSDWSDARSVVPATDSRPYPIAFIGRLDPIKDVPTLVRAAGMLSHLVHLHIYGEGPDRSRIEKSILSGVEASSLSAGDAIGEPKFAGLKTRSFDFDGVSAQDGCANITLHGAIASAQQALKQSGLLVLPSLAEGFGLVLIEAMAAGVPVVASDVAGIRDVVRHEHDGLLVPPSNSVAVSNAIRRIVEDRPLRDALIQNGLETVRSRFEWDVVLPMYKKLLKTGMIASATMPRVIED